MDDLLYRHYFNADCRSQTVKLPEGNHCLEQHQQISSMWGLGKNSIIIIY